MQGRREFKPRLFYALSLETLAPEDHELPGFAARHLKHECDLPYGVASIARVTERQRHHKKTKKEAPAKERPQGHQTSTQALHTLPGVSEDLRHRYHQGPHSDGQRIVGSGCLLRGYSGHAGGGSGRQAAAATELQNRGDFHGTRVAGIVIGNDRAQQHIGVAPNAQLVDCKIFDAAGTSPASRETATIACTPPPGMVGHTCLRVTATYPAAQNPANNSVQESIDVQPPQTGGAVHDGGRLALAVLCAPRGEKAPGCAGPALPARQRRGDRQARHREGTSPRGLAVLVCGIWRVRAVSGE